MDCYFRNSSSHNAPYDTIPNRLKALATQTPDKTAFVFRSALDDSRVCITYGELFRKSESIGKGLISKGVRKDDMVAIVDDGTPEGLLAIFGVQMTGAVPLIFRLSGKDGMDVVNMIQKTKCSMMIADPGHMDENWDVLQRLVQKTDIDGSVVSQKMPSLQTLILTKSPSTRDNLLTVQGLIKLAADVDCDLPEVDPDDNAVMFLTSGSTGPPKIVPQSHYALLLTGHYFDVASGTFGKSESVLFNDRPFIWIGGFSCWEIVNGGCRVIVQHFSKVQTIPEINKIVDRVVQIENCTCAFLITPFLQEMLTNDSYGMFLDTILTGGEPIHASLYASAGKYCKYFVAGYGSTEAGMVTMKRVSGPSSDDEDYLLGEPVSGIELKIINKDGKRCGIGETGELCVRSPVRFSGYLNREEVKKEVLIKGGWFRTSDMCHISEKGNIIIDGRASEAMILAGAIVLPSQLESDIKRHPAVRSVVVTSVSGEKIYEEAIAAVVLETGFSVTKEDLIKFLLDLKKSTRRAFFEPLRQEVLPKHYIFFDEFQRTFNGKINRKAVAEEAKRRLQLSKQK